MKALSDIVAKRISVAFFNVSGFYPISSTNVTCKTSESEIEPIVNGPAVISDLAISNFTTIISQLFGLIPFRNGTKLIYSIAENGK